MGASAHSTVEVHPDVAEVLFTTEQIDRRVRELAEAVSRDYAGLKPLVVGVLKGAIVFLADLLRYLTIPVTVDFVAWASYGQGSTSSGVMRILKDLEEDVTGRHIIIVEDIVDTGLTLHYLRENISHRSPASVKSVVFLDKPSRRQIQIQPDYLGFTAPDAFVVGYGLDYAQNYRYLPYIGRLRPEVYEQAVASAGRGQKKKF